MNRSTLQRYLGAGTGLAILCSRGEFVRAQNADTPAAESAPTASVRSESDRSGVDGGSASGATGVLDPPGQGWSFSAAAYSYFVPEGLDYVQPTLTVDRDGFHFEARYNYEDRGTGSTWVGWNLSGGSDWSWELTPMLGGVFGNVSGVAPGYKGSLGWWKLELYSEGEWVLDVANPEESFFYNWSELTIAPTEWLRFGLVTQRTRVYQAERDVQRGLLLGFSVDRIDFLTCVFNPDDSDPLLVMAVTISF